MKNYAVRNPQTGKLVWISRSMAVVAIIKVTKEDENYLLCLKRGPGCPDEVGKYAFCSGYLDYDETRKEAMIREVYEELGLDLNKMNWEIIEEEINDDPKDDPRQNLSTRYFIELDWNKNFEEYLKNLDIKSEDRGGEKNEVSKIELIDPEKIDKTDWAWNHKELANRVLKLNP